MIHFPLRLLQVPDYLMVVKRPMDFSTVLTNIDEHKYVTVAEFMSDVDLIWQNALEYNPDSDPMGETRTRTGFNHQCRNIHLFCDD